MDFKYAPYKVEHLDDISNKDYCFILILYIKQFHFTKQVGQCCLRVTKISPPPPEKRNR